MTPLHRPTSRQAHRTLWFRLLIFVCIFALTSCGQAEQAQLQTRAAEFVATEAAELAATGVAQLATEVARQLEKKWEVVLDPGHGWQGATGAKGNGLVEKDVALDLAFRTQAILQNRGVTTLMTRAGDDLEHDLTYAAQFVNEQAPDFVVSIHANSGGSTRSGTEACHTVGKNTDEASKALGRLLTDSIATKLAIPNGGIQPENSLTVCARTTQTGWTQLYIHDMNPPAVIIEVAFLTNAHDAELLRTRQQDFAQAIADAIMAYIQTQS